MSGKKSHERDPFRVPLTDASGSRWDLWAYITDEATLLGFSATEAGASSISSLPGGPLPVSVRIRARPAA